MRPSRVFLSQLLHFLCLHLHLNSILPFEADILVLVHLTHFHSQSLVLNFSKARKCARFFCFRICNRGLTFFLQNARSLWFGLYIWFHWWGHIFLMAATFHFVFFFILYIFLFMGRVLGLVSMHSTIFLSCPVKDKSHTLKIGDLQEISLLRLANPWS